MSDAQLARLEERQEALIRGVAQMNDTLGLLSAMLEQILKAATQPPPKSELGETPEAHRRPPGRTPGGARPLDDRLADLPEKIAAALTSPAP